jgi:hypothetical protein
MEEGIRDITRGKEVVRGVITSRGGYSMNITRGREESIRVTRRARMRARDDGYLTVTLARTRDDG